MSTKGQIRDMVMISERSDEVEDRAVPGHWEGDLLMGRRQTAIGTLVERRSRYVMLFPLPDGNTQKQSALLSLKRCSVSPNTCGGRRPGIKVATQNLEVHLRFKLFKGFTAVSLRQRAESTPNRDTGN